MSTSKVAPFLKWPGGKRWLAPRLVQLIRPALRGTYFEPFLGGGAVFFELRPENAILSDVNDDLVNTYLQVRRRPGELIERLRHLPVSAEGYYGLRSAKPRTKLMRAARFLYLNRTAFAGIYRVNRRGEFNVPYGGGQRTPAGLTESRLLRDASRLLSCATVLCDDFEHAMRRAGAGDVVYCDPTYTVAHNNNGFVRYNEQNFSWADQQRLARAAEACRAAGATVLISNAVHPSIAALYRADEVVTYERFSCVSPRRSGRRRVEEQVIVLKGGV